MKFYKDEKYWNADLRDEFERDTNGLWLDHHSDKYNGRIFSTGGVDKDYQNAMMRINSEMDSAIEKYGKVNLPSNLHIDDFYNRIDNAKENIAKA